MKLMPLSHADARRLCEVVSRVGRWSMMDVIAAADQRTNTIVLAGPKQQIREASSLIRQLDVKVAPPPKKPPAKKSKKGGQKIKKKAKHKHSVKEPVSKQAPPAKNPSPAQTDV